MYLKAVSAQFVISEHPRRDYNPQEWGKIVQRLSGYGAKFYTDLEGGKVYAIYTIPKEFKVFSELSYVSSLSMASFNEVIIDSTGQIGIKKRGISNTSKGRAYMTKASEDFGSIFTNEF